MLQLGVKSKYMSFCYNGGRHEAPEGTDEKTYPLGITIKLSSILIHGG